MSANAETTLIALLNHKNILFNMIDYADSLGAKGAREFSVPLYHRQLSETLSGLSTTEKRRLGGILSLENLKANGLLVYWDNKSDTFVLKPFVLAMFRHLEAHRLQELSDAELNGLRGRLKEVYDDVSSPGYPWDPQSMDYQEKFVHAISTLRDISDRIDQNVSSLDGQAKRLAEIVDKELEADVGRTEQLHHALKRIFDLTERYIRPTLRFLNPDLAWRGGDKPPMSLVAQIMERFERRGLSEEYGMMSRIYWNLLRASEEIAVVRKRLDVYIKLYEHQRRLHNAIEKRYNALMEEITDSQDGKLKGNRIDPERSSLCTGALVRGLKVHSIGQRALIDLPPDPGTAQLDEHLRVRLDRQKSLRRDVVDSTEQPSTTDEADVERRKRFSKLLKVAKHITLAPHQDIYDQLHVYLLDHLEGYQLSDLLDIYSMAVPGKENVRVNLQEKKHIHHEGRVLSYYERVFAQKGQHQ